MKESVYLRCVFRITILKDKIMGIMTKQGVFQTPTDGDSLKQSIRHHVVEQLDRVCEDRQKETDNIVARIKQNVSFPTYDESDVVKVYDVRQAGRNIEVETNRSVCGISSRDRDRIENGVMLMPLRIERTERGCRITYGLACDYYNF